MLFFVSSKQHFLGKTLSEYLFFTIFFSILKVRLNLKYGSFFNGHFLIIMRFKIRCFHFFQNSITVDRKIILTSGFH